MIVVYTMAYFLSQFSEHKMGDSFIDVLITKHYMLLLPCQTKDSKKHKG